MRSGLVLAAALLSFSLVAPAAPASGGSPAGHSAKAGKGKTMKPKKCKDGKVLVRFGKKARCLRVSKALPKPKPGDPRAVVISDALTPDIAKIPDPKDRLPPPMEQVYRKLGPQALKGMEQSVGIAIRRLDALAAKSAGRPGAATASEEANTFSHRFGNVTVDARISIALVGAELVGTAQFGTTTDHGDGTTVRVSTEIPLRLNEIGFRTAGCPTADGKVNAKDGLGITVRTEVRSNQGKTLEEFYRTEVVDETELQGVVGDDAKLDTLEIRSIQEIKEVTGGSIFGHAEISGSIVRNTVVDMRTGEYQPHVTLVNVGVKLSGILSLFAPYLRPLIAERLKRTADKDFATTVDVEMKNYRELETAWNEPNKCAKLEFGHKSGSLTLHRNDSGTETVRLDAKPGGSPQKATWALTDQASAVIGAPAGTANPNSFTYKVAVAGEGIVVKAKIRAVSKAGVAEDTWTQPTKQDSTSEISGIFTYRTEFFGSIFEVAGNADFFRWTPPIFGGSEGGYKMLSGLYTFTVSGSAAQLVTNKCSMRGSGQFALAKNNEFSVFSKAFDGEPPYEYTFGVASEGLSELPMIEIETYNCSPEADELEGDKFPYPAAFAMSTPTPYTSADGIKFADTLSKNEGGAKLDETWSFEAVP